MALTTFTESEDKFIISNVGKLSFAQIGKKLGRTRNSVRGRYLYLTNKFFEFLAREHAKGQKAQMFEREESENEIAITARSSTIRTLDDALKAGNVDLNVWYVKKHVINKWDGFARVRSYKAAEDDWRRQLTTIELFQVKVWLERKVARPVKTFLDELKEDMRRHAPRYRPSPKIPKLFNPYMVVLALFDAHFGKLAWAAETGQNSDLKISDAIYRNAVVDIMAEMQGRPVEKIVIPVGSDFFHIDNVKNTTINNTPQDTDSRYHKIFKTGKKAVIWAVEYAAQIAPVEIIWVRGNHDATSGWHLAETLGSWFHNHDRVTVNDGPSPRKCVRFGASLVGMTHGDEENHRSLPAIMSTGWPEDWAATTTHDWLIGHYHKKKETEYVAVDEHDGVTVRICPSLSAKDAWHNLRGYLGNRAAQGHLYNFNRGYAGCFEAKVRED